MMGEAICENVKFYIDKDDSYFGWEPGMQIISLFFSCGGDGYIHIG